MTWGKLIVAAIALFTAGCATPAAEQPATLANVQALRTPGMPLFALGTFSLAPNLPASLDRSIAVRTAIIKPPTGSSFAQYLRQTLEAQLSAAGKLDPAAGTVISGQLTRSQVETTPPTSSGALGAKFQVSRTGVLVFDREFVITEQWDSAFLGAVAVPEGVDRYTALYTKLVSKLLSDPDFKAAVSR